MSILITDDSTRAELAEALTNLTKYAKRQQCIVERFTDDPPTAWTVAHRRINAVLEDWERAQA